MQPQIQRGGHDDVVVFEPHVEEGVDPRLLEGLGLGGSAAGDEGDRGPDVVDHLELGGPDLRGNEAEDPDPLAREVSEASGPEHDYSPGSRVVPRSRGRAR